MKESTWDSFHFVESLKPHDRGVRMFKNKEKNGINVWKLSYSYNKLWDGSQLDATTNSIN